MNPFKICPLAAFNVSNIISCCVAATFNPPLTAFAVTPCHWPAVFIASENTSSVDFNANSFVLVTVLFTVSIVL